jgi:hypothetical protein
MWLKAGGPEAGYRSAMLKRPKIDLPVGRASLLLETAALVVVKALLLVALLQFLFSGKRSGVPGQRIAQADLDASERI